MELNEHETMLEALAFLISTSQGKIFLKYLLKHFAVGEMPPIGMPDGIKEEYMGLLRAGNSIFEIMSQADSIKTGLLLAEIQKEKYDVAKK